MSLIHIKNLKYVIFEPNILIFHVIFFMLFLQINDMIFYKCFFISDLLTHELKLFEYPLHLTYI